MQVTDALPITLGLGFVLGMRHSLDADHLVAVAAIAGRERSIRSSYRVGLFWGLGHSVALLVASGFVLALRSAIPEGFSSTLETLVGVMLVALGTDLLVRIFRGRVRKHVHESDPGSLRDPKHHEHEHFVPQSWGRPFFVGLVHGLAGSGALTLLVLTTIVSPWVGLFYVLLFGIGTLAGMAAMSTLLALPFALAAERAPALASAVQLVAAIGSIGYGALYAFQAMTS